MKLTNNTHDHHRNGVFGHGFYVHLFDWTDEDGKAHHMVAVDFEADRAAGAITVAVFDVDELKAGNIAFAEGNSWRGDHFSDALRRARGMKDNG